MSRRASRSRRAICSSNSTRRRRTRTPPPREDALNASLAEIARRRFAIEAVRSAEAEEARAAGGSRTRARRGRRRPAGSRSRRPSRRSPGGPSSRSPGTRRLPESFRLREEAVLRADLTQLSDALKALDKQMAQKLATRKRLDMSIAFQRTLMDTLNAARRDAPGGDRPAGRHQDQPLRRQGGAGEVAIAARLRRGPADRDRRGAEGAAEREGEDGLAVHRRQ